MKKKKERCSEILILSIVLIMNSCAMKMSNMIPFINYSGFNIDKTLRVTKVTGWENIPAIDRPFGIEDGFQQALVNTLEKSGIFKTAFIHQNGDYELHTEVISQKMLLGVIKTSTLFVHYKLIETKANRVIWSENILSQYESEGVGQEANEGAVRDNLSQLISKLSKILNQPDGTFR